MTELSQRIAIAEECGWTEIVDQSEFLMMPPGYSVVGYPPEGTILDDRREIPEYFRDWNTRLDMLNIMADKHLLGTFYQEFARVMELEETTLLGCFWLGVSISQPEFCKVFLRTVGRWIDEKPFDSGKTPS